MSGSFSYEIDEEKLRASFRESEPGFSEKDWDKYTIYMRAHDISDKASPQVNFKIKADKKLVIPVASALTAILAFVLLVNLTGGDKREKAGSGNNSGHASPVQTEISSVPPAERAVKGPVKKEPVPVQGPEIRKPEPAVAATSKTTEPVAARQNKTVTAKPAATDSIPEIATIAVPTTAAADTSSTATATDAKNKRRKRAAEIEAGQVTDIVPGLIQEERQPEERP